jgi:high-affinity Fe2+/Pb2+ permease
MVIHLLNHILREGVEVIIFYMGMMGSIKTLDFVIGIILAIVILIQLYLIMLSFDYLLHGDTFVESYHSIA